MPESKITNIVQWEQWFHDDDRQRMTPQKVSASNKTDGIQVSLPERQ